MTNTATETYAVIRKDYRAAREMLGVDSLLHLNQGMSKQVRKILSEQGVKMKTKENGRLEVYLVDAATAARTDLGIIAIVDKTKLNDGINAANEEWHKEFPNGRFPRSEKARYDSNLQDAVADSITLIYNDTPKKVKAPKAPKAAKAPGTKRAVGTSWGSNPNPFTVGDELFATVDGAVVYYTVVKTTKKTYTVAPLNGGSAITIRLKRKDVNLAAKNLQGLLGRVEELEVAA